MKVTSLIIAALAILVSVESFAEPVKPARRRRPAHAVKASGGLIFSEVKGKAVTIVNFDNSVADKVLEPVINDIKLHIRVPIKVVAAPKGTSVTNKVAALLKKDDVSAVIALSNCECVEFFKYDEDKKVVYVNVAALKKDGAADNIAEGRLTKQLWRAIGAILKAGDSGTGFTIIKRADNIKELDAITGRLPDPMQHNRMVGTIDKLGMKMIKAGTYRSACLQGWAPKPTTPEQVKIWNEVYSPPTNPIKIKYQPKK